MKRSETVTRCFQPYTSDDRANHAASRRMGHVKRHAVGEFFYVSSYLPNRAFSSRGWAEREEAPVIAQLQHSVNVVAA